MEVEMNEEVTESSSAGSITSAKRTSPAWAYFDEIPAQNNKRRVKCKRCEKEYVYNGTSNLLRHISDLCEFGDHAGVQRIAEFNEDVYRGKLAKAMVKHNLPYKFVEYEGIREVFTYLNPQVKHICRNTGKADILRLYQVEKEKLKKELEKLNGRICLTSDLWTSSASNGYMTITAHFVDSNWVLQSRVLIFRHVPPPHDGTNIGEKLISFLQEWGIERKVLTLTLDNAKYNEGVVDRLRNHLLLMGSAICGGKFLHIRCGAHILNLVVHSGLETIDVSVEKIRESVKYVRGSESRTLKFAECVNYLGLKPGKKLIQDLPFRWNSTYLMIQNALAYKSAFMRFNIFDSKYKWCPEPHEWLRVERIAAFLQPFFDMTELFSGTKYPTANLYFLNVWSIQKLIKKEMGSRDVVIKVMAEKMKPKFDKYWDTYSTILSFAIILDPRYKLQFVKFAYEALDDEKADEKFENLKTDLE